MEHDEYDDLLRRLTALVGKLDSTYDALLEANQQQREMNTRVEGFMARQDTINERLERTLHAITLILGRDNGR